MKIIEVNNANIRISENCYLFDMGIVDCVDIDIDEGINVQYCFVRGISIETMQKKRYIRLQKNANFIGTGVMLDSIDIEIITEVIGDNVTSQLDLLALASSKTNISIQGIVRVDSPYRHISTRVDQTNILIGAGARVRWIPQLEIATEDIEGGHSCRVHRIGGEALFYFTSRWLTPQNAETLLLNSEILRHIRTIHPNEKEKICRDIHTRLIKK